VIGIINYVLVRLRKIKEFNNQKPIPPPSAVGFTHLGDEAPLAKKNNQHKACRHDSYIKDKEKNKEKEKEIPTTSSPIFVPR
jgi:hypothetical protein